MMLLVWAVVIALLSVPFMPHEKARLMELNEYVEDTNFILEDRCSAVLIDDGYLLTAHHCIASKLGFITNKRDANGNHVITPDLPVIVTNPYRKQAFKAVIVKHDKTIDLALLKITKSVTGQPLDPYRKVRHVLESDREVLRGQRVYTVGNPSMFTYSVTEGVISRANFIHRAGAAPAALKIQFDARIAGGASGGALVDEDGRLIGILSYAQAMFIPTGDWVDKAGFAVSYKTINEFLK